MPRKKKMPKREWAVIQAVDGIEYLVPFGEVDDPEPNCRTIPVLDAVAAEARLVQVRELADRLCSCPEPSRPFARDVGLRLKAILET